MPPFVADECGMLYDYQRRGEPRPHTKERIYEWYNENCTRRVIIVALSLRSDPASMLTPHV